jgi:hypothetical protein
LTAADFDRDGYTDLGVGVYNAANVIYGSGSGLAFPGMQRWDQDSPGVPDSAESGDDFGAALAAGDFDGDGTADLAVGVPREDLGYYGWLYYHDHGAVNVLHGTVHGITASGSQFWHQDSAGVLGHIDPGREWLGSALAAGDFDGDGYADLAVGVPGDFDWVYIEYCDTWGEYASGAVNVLYGSSSGLTATGDQLWRQSRSLYDPIMEGANEFGAALAVGDFDGDGYADLAVGDPAQGEAEGTVNIIYGSYRGLTTVGLQIWHQNSPGIISR